MMTARLTLFFAVLCIPLSLAAKGKFSYRPCCKWGGTCDTGKKQSPINIADTEVAPVSDGKIKIVTFGTISEYLIFFTGVCLEVHLESDKFTTPPEIYVPANDYTIGDSTTVKKGQLLKVQPKQFHFHTTSEHTIDGAYAAGELHIVTFVEKGQSDYCDKHWPCIAVFGVMLQFPPNLKDGNEIFDDFVKELPSASGKEYGHHGENLNLDDLLPKSWDYYTYMGSLTTPQCNETVTWIVFKEPVRVSTNFVKQHQLLVCFTPGVGCTLTVFHACFPPREKTNNRMVQPLNGRSVYSVKYSKPTAFQFAT